MAVGSKPSFDEEAEPVWESGKQPQRVTVMLFKVQLTDILIRPWKKCIHEVNTG